MQITVEDISALTKKIKVQLPSELVAAKIDAAFEELKADVAIKGFRKGKAPRRFLEKSYGPKVKQEVAEKLIQDTYFDALAKSDLDAVVHPQINRHEYGADNSFSYEAEVDVRPQFELGQYKALSVELPEIVVDDATVDAVVEKLRQRNAPLRPVTDRPAREGDSVTIDFQGYHEGQKMTQVAGEKYVVEIGSGRNGKEFEAQMVGLSAGEETTRRIEFPAGFANPVLAGKEIEFKITVNSIKEPVLPELDDEFAKDIDTNLASLADLREHIRVEQVTSLEEKQKGDMADILMKQLLDSHDFEVPNRLVIYEAEMMVKETEQAMINRGTTIEAAGISRDKLANDYREPAAKRVKGDFIIKKIADAEGIKVNEQDMEMAFGRVARQYNMALDEVKNYFRNREYLMPLMNELLNEKVLDFLRENAEVKRVPAAA